MHQFKRVVASGLAVLITVQATGCTAWKTVDQPVPLAVAASPNRKVQVILQDYRKFDADSATTDATTVIAYRGYAVDTIPMANVKAVKVRQSSPWKTAALTVILVVVGVITFGAIVASIDAYGD